MVTCPRYHVPYPVWQQFTRVYMCPDCQPTCAGSPYLRPMYKYWHIITYNELCWANLPHDTKGTFRVWTGQRDNFVVSSLFTDLGHSEHYKCMCIYNKSWDKILQMKITVLETNLEPIVSYILNSFPMQFKQKLSVSMFPHGQYMFLFIKFRSNIIIRLYTMLLLTLLFCLNY